MTPEGMIGEMKKVAYIKDIYILKLDLKQTGLFVWAGVACLCVSLVSLTYEKSHAFCEPSDVRACVVAMPNP